MVCPNALTALQGLRDIHQALLCKIFIKSRCVGTFSFSHVNVFLIKAHVGLCHCKSISDAKFTQLLLDNITSTM